MVEWVGAIAGVISVALLIILYVFQIGKRFGQLELRIDHLEEGLRALRQDMETQLRALRQDMETQLRALRQDMEGQLLIQRQDLEKQMGALRQEMRGSIADLRSRLDALIDVQALTISMFQARWPLTSEELNASLRAFARVTIKSAEENTGRWGKGNPLTAEESNRFMAFIWKARRGEFFTPEEVEDYRAIVRKIERENPRDPDVVPFITLGAVLWAFFGIRREKPETAGRS